MTDEGQPVPQPEPAINPYAPTAPRQVDQSVEPETAPTDQPRSLRRTSIRWLVVCTFSALPSFVWGMVITGGQAVAMILGIVIFVVGYTLLDYHTARWPVRAKATVQRTLRIAYGTRIAISVLFPIGAYLDMACGVFAVAATQSIAGAEFRPSEEFSFLAVFATTLTQGVILNIVLACYAVIVHLVQITVVALRR